MNILKQKISSLIAFLFLATLLVTGLFIFTRIYLPDSYFEFKSFQFLKKGIYVKEPSANDKIFSPLEITGYINGNGWIAFEAQAGIVNLLDEKGNILGTTVLKTTDENWMKKFNNFEANLEFYSENEQSGKLVFHNENPSGLPSNDKEFVLPVFINKSGQSRTEDILQP